MMATERISSVLWGLKKTPKNRSMETLRKVSMKTFRKASKRTCKGTFNKASNKFPRKFS
jgi:hypothetical protein